MESHTSWAPQGDLERSTTYKFMNIQKGVFKLILCSEFLISMLQSMGAEWICGPVLATD